MVGKMNPAKAERRKALYERYQGKNIAAMAKEEGIGERKMYEWIARAKREGLIGDFAGKVPDGMEVASVNISYDKDGNVTRESLGTRPQREKFKGIPDGHSLKGVSVNVDADGNIAQQWYKSKELPEDPARVAEIVRKAFEKFEAKAPAIARPRIEDTDMLTVYPVLDWHMGMYAWGKETDDEDWDLAKAKDVLGNTFAEIVEQAPASGRAVFIGLGDLMHSDNNDNRTSRSGNSLDVDSRYSKVLSTTCDLIVECINVVAAKHKDVTVALKRGNHDDHSTMAMLQALRMYYRTSKRVSVDDNPDSFFWCEHGVNLIGGTHGDKQRIERLPMVMATKRREEWGRTKSHHIFTGHLHHERSCEIEGVRCWTLRAPIPSDAYHASAGYLSGRSMYAFNYHAKFGSRGSIEVEIY